MSGAEGEHEGSEGRDTMPRSGQVRAARSAWLVRTDGALAHRLQDGEISGRLCDNRQRNRTIRQDFPLALGEQLRAEGELQRLRLLRLRQAERDAALARRLAACRLSGPAPAPDPALLARLEQEERDASLARELSREDEDALLADVRCAVEAQDGELARLLQEKEFKKLQRAKEKARQKALLKKRQRPTAERSPPDAPNGSVLLDAYSNPRDVIREASRSASRSSKSIDSDLNYVEPFEKEHVQSKADALRSMQTSQQWYSHNSSGVPSISTGAGFGDVTNNNVREHAIRSVDSANIGSTRAIATQHRQPPPVPTCTKKPRFPDPVSIRAASRYPSNPNLCDEPSPEEQYNNNGYGSTFPQDHNSMVSTCSAGSYDNSGKRMSVVSNTTDTGSKKKNKKTEEKKRGCTIQ